jgi:hypothetical protein
MTFLSKLVSATVATALLAGTALGDDTVGAGKVKSVSGDNQTFVLTDSADKDWTFTCGDLLVVNRNGKESKSGLKAGDAIQVCYDKGIDALTAHYILVQEGTTKNCGLVRGNVKSYNADKKQLVFTGQNVKDSASYSMGDAQVRVNMRDSKIDAIENGDRALIIVETTGDKTTLRSVMVDRK